MSQRIVRSSITVLFLKRSVKYLCILAILVAMTIPLITTSYNLAKQKVVDESAARLNEGIMELHKQMMEAKEIGSLLLEEPEYINLLLAQGPPAPELYMDINAVQTKLAKLCMTRNYMTNAYITFRNNPIFLSNYISSDDYRRVYPTLFSDRNQTVEEWRDALFQQADPITILPGSSLYSSYYSSSEFKGITCIIHNEYYHFLNRDSVFACIFTESAIAEGIGYTGRLEDGFYFLADQNDNILLAQHYEGSPLELKTLHGGSLRYKEKEYIFIKSAATDLGLYAAIGIPVEFLDDSMDPMIAILFRYIIGGVAVCLLLSTIFSMREALSMSKLIETVAPTAKPSAKIRNEYQYVGTAIQRLNSANMEYLSSIERLNHTIQTSMLENLFFMGAYTRYDQEDILRYFHNSFEVFCVAIIRLSGDEDGLMEQMVRQNTMLRMEECMELYLRHDYVSIHNSTNEMAMVVFPEQNSGSDVKMLKAELQELVFCIHESAELSPVINIGLSTFASGIDKVREAYLQAKDAIHFSSSPDTDGIYIYNTPRYTVHKKTLDIAILTKCYDAILSGDSEALCQLFGDIEGIIGKMRPGESEKMQLFYTLRQPVYNARLEIIANGGQVEEGTELKPFCEQDSARDILQGIRETAFHLCDLVQANKRNINYQIKENVIACIRENIADPNLSAAMISSRLLISEKYVFVAVKDITGKALGKYIEELRIELSEKLLRTTEYTNSKIAAMCGFGSDKTFYRAFSKKHGVSPSAWRKID